jgi:retron-type reverse transcriptase
MMANNLKIIAWNARGLKDRRNELHFFLSARDIDIALISETKLTEHEVFRIPSYEIYRTDRPARPHGRNPGGGTAVLVHRRLVHRPHVTATGSLETTGVFVHVGGHEHLVVSAYQPPGRQLDARTLDSLFNINVPLVLAGDLNAKHQSWNSRVSNPRGRALRNLLDHLGDINVIAPPGPTYIPDDNRHRPDVLDIALCRNLVFPVTAVNVNDLSSDHTPVLLTIDAAPTTSLPPAMTTVKTDWEKFRQLVSERFTPFREPADAAELDESVRQLHDLLSSSIADAAVPVPPKGSKPKLPHDIRQAIRRRNWLRRRWRRDRHPEVKRQLTWHNRLIKNLVDDFRTENWNQYLSTLNFEGGSVWRAAKQVRGTKPTRHPLHGQRGLVYAAEDKTETFADTMFDQFQTNPDIYNERHEERVENFMENFFDDPPEDRVEPFTLPEVHEAIRRLRPRKAPGMDGISHKALQLAPEEIAIFLHLVFNSVLRLCHFPTAWKTAKIILIPKPGKDHLFPQNHRPISLLPVISKLFERLLLSRISPFLEGFIRPEQFGFRRGHSTTQQLVRVVNSLVDNHNVNLCSVAVLLDVSKAFDKVWHEGLLFKLSESPIPTAAVHLLKSYLQGRTFQTTVEGKLSTVRQVEAGVPQGSVLGPVLYLIYTNDMPTIPGVTLSLYADDAFLHCRSARPALAVSRMQRQMDALSPWLEKWRIKVNADKSNAICFRKRRKMPSAPPPQVLLDGEPIPWKPTVKYLGVTLDTKLRFKQHVDRKVTEAVGILGLLGPLLHVRSPLPVSTKVTLFIMIVRSCMLYASEAWWALASKSNRRRLETIQSKFLRRTTRQPWFVRNETIRNSTGVQTLDIFTKQKTCNLFQRARESDLEHIRDLCRRFDIAEDWRPRPIAILDDPP